MNSFKIGQRVRYNGCPCVIASEPRPYCLGDATGVLVTFGRRSAWVRIDALSVEESKSRKAGEMLNEQR